MKNSALILQARAQFFGISQITVMRQRQRVTMRFDKKRLDIFKSAGTGGRITDMADCLVAFKFF